MENDCDAFQYAAPDIALDRNNFILAAIGNPSKSREELWSIITAEQQNDPVMRAFCGKNVTSDELYYGIYNEIKSGTFCKDLMGKSLVETRATLRQQSKSIFQGALSKSKRCVRNIWKLTNSDLSARCVFNEFHLLINHRRELRWIICRPCIFLVWFKSSITGHITTQMIEKYGREVSKRRQAKAAIVKLTDAKKNKG